MDIVRTYYLWGKRSEVSSRLEASASCHQMWAVSERPEAEDLEGISSDVENPVYLDVALSFQYDWPGLVLIRHAWTVPLVL